MKISHHLLLLLITDEHLLDKKNTFELLIIFEDEISDLPPFTTYLVPGQDETPPTRPLHSPCRRGNAWS